MPEIRLQRRGIGCALGLAGAALFTGGALYAANTERNRAELVELSLPVKRLKPQFDGYTIAHISDLHMDGIGLTASTLGQTVSWINTLRPDLVTVTGDFVTYLERRFAPRAADGLGQLHAPDGVAAVLGNHDHVTNGDVVASALEGAGVRVLSNAAFTVERDGAHLHVAGVDDIVTGNDDMAAALKAVPDDDNPAVLLSHAPDFADISAKTGRFALQLSGHSHGGQMVPPGREPLYLPEYGQKYYTGMYRVGDMVQYTNRGLGTVGVNVRVNCPAELTLITLRAA